MEKININEVSAPGIPLSRRKVRSGLSINELTSQIRGPFIVVISGVPVLRKDWDYPVKADVIIMRFPLGSDGRGSDIGRVVAMIGVVALAMWAPAAVFGLTGIWASLGSAAIMMGGSMLVNALMPIKQPVTDSGAITGNATSYSLGRAQNVARINEVIPVQYGRVKQTPSLISPSWKEYVNNEEYVYILLCLGWGEFEIDQLRLDVSDFSSFSTEDLEYSVLGPGETIPYHDNMFTSPAVDNIEIKNPFTEGYTSAPISLINASASYDYFRVYPYSDAESLAIDEIMTHIPIGCAIIINGSSLNTAVYTVTAKTRIRINNNDYNRYYWIVEVGSASLTYEDINNGSISVTIESEANIQAVTPLYPTDYAGSVIPYEKTVYCDILFPNGLYYMEDDGDLSSLSVNYGIIYQTLSPEGVRGSIELLGSVVTISSIEDDLPKGNRTARRYTLSATLPSEAVAGTGNTILVGITQENPDAPNNRRINQAYWSGLRVQYDDKGSYEGLTTIPIKARASSGVNGDALSRISVISTRKLPIWNNNSESWSEPTATRSIAWAVADCLRNSQYSLGIPESKIDMDALLALHEIWEGNNDYCDGVFETKTPFWDALEMILRTGRASRNMVAGVITFYRDQPQLSDRAVFNMGNIERGSFKMDVVMYDPETPDDVEVEYLSNETWAWEKELCVLEGSDSVAPATIKKWGITEQAHVQREGLWEAACNMYRRVFISFKTALDGRIILRGQRVSVSYPLPSWGVSGFIKTVGDGFLILSEAADFDGEEIGYVSFRKDDGTLDGPYEVTEYTGNSFRVNWTESSVPNYVRGLGDTDDDPTLFQFGTAEDNGDAKCIVLYAKPQSEGKVELYCVKEDDRVHNTQVEPV